jgi:Tfp pilus assembly protein FimT
MGMSQGYSIFEVTITLALTGILLGISVPSFNMLERLSLKEDAWKTVSMVTRAKNLALLRAADYFVLFQPLSVTIVTEGLFPPKSSERRYGYGESVRSNFPSLGTE